MLVSEPDTDNSVGIGTPLACGSALKRAKQNHMYFFLLMMFYLKYHCLKLQKIIGKKAKLMGRQN